MYALFGTDQPNGRFQFSFQYQILNPEGSWASHLPFLAGIYLGYTQQSLWDLEDDSKPFTDTNYRPEIAWSTDKLSWLNLPGVDQTGLQAGFQHESNGRDGRDSRSVNLAYIRPVLHFGDPEGLHWQFAPKVYCYLPDREDNPDISDYRGYCDFGLTVGWKAGFQAAAIGRIGSSGENGSIQIDLTYPLRALGEGNFDLFLQVQWFSGYGESLITYDQYTDALRVGVGLVR
jgi:outer membrane phospholipase A